MIELEASGNPVQNFCFREGSMKKNLHQQLVNGAIRCARMVVLFSLIASQFFGASQPVFATGNIDVGIVLPGENDRWLQDKARFEDALTTAGFTSEVLFSQDDSDIEKANVESLLAKNIKVLVICPNDSDAAAAAVEEARLAGVKIIAYDRPIMNTAAVDFFVTFDSFSVGQAQGQYLVDHATGSGNPLYLYAGSTSDNNAFQFFEGAWSVLQPKIVDGTFVIENSSAAVALKNHTTLTHVEQEAIFAQIAIAYWDPANAGTLAADNLAAVGAGGKGNVFILAPNDGTARSIADVFTADIGITNYKITGQDAERDSVQYIIDGKQSMTVFKDIRTLVDDAIATAETFLALGTPASTTTYNNGLIDVPADPTETFIVDQSNFKAVLIDTGYYNACDFTGLPISICDVGIILPGNHPRWLQDQIRFEDALTTAGFTSEVLLSQNDSAIEKTNVESLLAKKIKVLIICPEDGNVAAAAVEEARDAGVKVIAYDRLIMNTEAVDYYVTFDSISVGEQMGQYLVDHATGTGNPLYLYAGAPSDNNAFLFFEGSWSVLQPKIADGTFVIENSSAAVALQNQFTLTHEQQAGIIAQITTEWDWDTARNLAQANLAAVGAEKGDVFILAPNDGTTRSIADVFAADSGVTSYVITGQDAERDSIEYIIDSKQSMTVFKDVRTLVDDAIAAAEMFLALGTPASTTTYNNGTINVPADPTETFIVDQSNFKAILIDTGYYNASDFTRITGTIYLTSAAPENAMAGVMVEACTSGNFCQTTMSDGSGNYRVNGLQAGTYNLRAIPPGSNLPGRLGPITISSVETLSGQDIIVSEPPLPPPPDAVVPSHSGGGTVAVNWMDSLTLTDKGCINGTTAAFKLTVLDDGYIINGTMTETPAGSGTYKATIPSLHPHHGATSIVYTITCPGGSKEETPFFIYIDPSGVVKDTFGAPISNATVTLFHADSADGPFTEVPDGSTMMSESNRKNPDTTNTNGQFGWDVVAGYYKVRAEKAGCFSPGNHAQSFVESAVLTIPPPVTDLELILECRYKLYLPLIKR
jgi:putative multiple sugar transport system substrate-binding protein